MPKDYYAVLGVKKDATDDELKKAFRRLAHEHHPDKGGDPAKFKDVNEAYQVLSDKQKRQMYDQFGSAAFDQAGAGSPGGFWTGDFGQGFQGAGFEDLGDMLGEMFGFGGGKRSGQARGRDIQTDVELTFREAAFGVEKTLRLYKTSACSRCHGNGADSGSKISDCKTCHGTGQVRQVQRTIFGSIQVATACSDCHGRGKKPEKPCSVCRGTGIERREQPITVRIPSGIDNGEAIKVTGEGEAVPYGGRSGDLYLRIRIKPDPHFIRDGWDMRSTVAFPFSVLALGDRVTVETLDGPAKLDIPAGTNPGAEFPLRGKGIANGRGGRGSHIITVTTEMPRKLSREQRELLEALKKKGM